MQIEGLRRYSAAFEYVRLVFRKARLRGARRNWSWSSVWVGLLIHLINKYRSPIGPSFLRVLVAWSTYRDIVGDGGGGGGGDWRYRPPNSPLYKRERDWSPNVSRNVFWDRYWGHVSQLSAKFFSIPSNSPRCLCGQCTTIMGILLSLWWGYYIGCSISVPDRCLISCCFIPKSELMYSTAEKT